MTPKRGSAHKVQEPRERPSRNATRQLALGLALLGGFASLAGCGDSREPAVGTWAAASITCTDGSQPKLQDAVFGPSSTFQVTYGSDGTFSQTALVNGCTLTYSGTYLRNGLTITESRAKAGCSGSCATIPFCVAPSFDSVVVRDYVMNASKTQLELTRSAPARFCPSGADDAIFNKQN